MFFFSMIEAQTICKCFIGLFIMSLIFKRSRSTLAMSAKLMLRWGRLACTFLQMCKEMRLYFFGARLFVENPFVEYDCKSNTTLGRKNDQKRHLVDFFYERSTTLGRKKSTNRPSVVICCFETKVSYFSVLKQI